MNAPLRVELSKRSRVPEMRPATEAPEHGNERRRFLMWCLMAGYIKPERVVERIVAEIESEATT